MPRCFTLTPKGETEPRSLHKIDEEICRLMMEPIDPKLYYMGWFDRIGFALASGDTFAQIEKSLIQQIDKELASPTDQWRVEFLRDYLYINTYLSMYYTSNAWWESK